MLISSLYQTEYPKLYRVGYHLTGDKQLTLDLIQDTFLLALFRSQTLASHPCREGWLMLTLTNLIKNERRKLSAQNIPLDLLKALPAPAAPEKLDALFPTGLSPEDRTVLTWRYELDLEYREIAQRLGISQSGCRDRVSRAVKRCRKLLEDQ